jgi:predicted RNA-binding protein with PUA-like domain
MRESLHGRDDRHAPAAASEDPASGKAPAEFSMNHWLFKSEPDTFSIDDLKQRPKGTEPWDGVRNYQARNFMRDGMRKGDEAFFYHSNCAEPGVVGIVRVLREAYPDSSAFDPDSPYFDPKSDPAAPRWMMVDVKFVRRLKRTITLAELKANPALEGFPLVRKGNRLSVLPVDARFWTLILAME